MKLAFTGAQSTGKTTLLKELKRDPDFSLKFDFRDEITRRMQKKGLSINESGNDITQLLIMNSHIKNTLIDNVIMDRCIIDGLVYTNWLHTEGKVSDTVQSTYDKAYKELVNNLYSFLYKPSPVRR